MKKKDIQDLKNRSIVELTNLEHESKERLRTLRFDLAAGKVKNVAELHDLKKKIARIKTFIKSHA